LIRISLLACALSFSLAACGDDGGDGNVSDCTTSTLTYANFGSAYMTSYCLGCHSTNASNRQGAPISVNFDTLEQVQNQASRVDARSGAGSSMPPVSFSSIPSGSERTMLSEWIDCGTN
jgi:uncharacterized membrane protein